MTQVLGPIDCVPGAGEVLEGWYMGYRWMSEIAHGFAVEMVFVTGSDHSTPFDFYLSMSMEEVEGGWGRRWSPEGCMYFIRVTVTRRTKALIESLPAIDPVVALCLEFNLGSAPQEARR